MPGSDLTLWGVGTPRTMRAHWMLEIKNGKRHAKLRLLPLDVRGVEFVLRFAIASSRLEHQE